MSSLSSLVILAIVLSLLALLCLLWILIFCFYSRVSSNKKIHPDAPTISSSNSQLPTLDVESSHPTYSVTLDRQPSGYSVHPLNQPSQISSFFTQRQHNLSILSIPSRVQSQPSCPIQDHERMPSKFSAIETL